MSVFSQEQTDTTVVSENLIGGRKYWHAAAQVYLAKNNLAGQYNATLFEVSHP